jgi:hypothetical protein
MPVEGGEDEKRKKKIVAKKLKKEETLADTNCKGLRCYAR